MLMKKFKKITTLLLIVTLLGSILAACNSNGKNNNTTGGNVTNSGNSSNGGEATATNVVRKEGFPIVDEAITLTIMSQDAGMADWKDMPTLQEMEALSNVKLNYQLVPFDSFATRKNLMFGSGDYPDFLYAADLSAEEQVMYGSQGALIPLNDLIDNGYAPNLKKILDENPDIRKNMTTPDGNIYALPYIDKTAVWYRGPVWYNGYFLEALGVTELPKTTDELYTYLKRVKEEDPNGNGLDDEIPLASVKLDDIRMFFLGFWGIYGPVRYVDDNGIVKYTPQEEGYKEYLTFLNKLFSEELLDPETFSQTDEQKKAKGSDGRVGLFSDYFPYFTIGDEPSDKHPLMTPVSSEMSKAVYGKHPGMSANGTFAITSANKHPEATMRWIDFQYSYEGATLFNQGPEGLLWEYVDEANHIKRWKEAPDGMEREEYRGTITPNYGILTPGINDPEAVKGLRNEFDDWISNETETKLSPIARPPFPNVYLSAEEQTEASTLVADLDTYVKQMEAKFVTGAEPLSNWDSYVEQLKKMGSERIVELYQGAYDRWNQN